MNKCFPGKEIAHRCVSWNELKQIYTAYPGPNKQAIFDPPPPPPGLAVLVHKWIWTKAIYRFEFNVSTWYISADQVFLRSYVLRQIRLRSLAGKYLFITDLDHFTGSPSSQFPLLLSSKKSKSRKWKLGGKENLFNRSWSENNHTRSKTTPIKHCKAFFIETPANIYLLESITWIPIEILYVLAHGRGSRPFWGLHNMM